MDQSEETKSQIVEDEVGGLGSFIWELVKILVLALIIIVPVRLFVAEPFIVSGSSMVPNFHDREYLVINKLGYRLGSPDRGDVIVLRYPKNPKEYYIKLPGDTIQIEKGSVSIANSQYPNGKMLDESYLPEGLVTTGTAGGVPVTLKDNEYYVMGDNRGASSDSRSWGVLPKDDIVGKVLFRILPISKLTTFSFSSPLHN
jgi:signal peptidase I